MTSWDETWTFYINYQPKPPKAEVVSITVNGKTVTNGGTVNIDRSEADVTIQIKNTGNSGHLYLTVLLDGSDLVTDYDLGLINHGSTVTKSFSVSGLSPGRHTMTVKVGH